MREGIPFQPDWASPPGETIADLLNERDISPAEFARRLGQDTHFANNLLDGHAAITADLARKIATLLGASESFWLNREQQYRDAINRRLNGLDRKAANEWLRSLPLQDMVKFGWIRAGHDSRETLNSCLHFFGVASPAACQTEYGDVFRLAAFKTSTSFESDPNAVAAWIRQGEIESASIDCKNWNPEGFRRELVKLRSLTREKNPDLFLPELQARCAAFGVAVVVLRAPSKCRASGAAHILPRGRRLLLLSFRYLSDDHFWFTFFHEAAHLLLHCGEKLILDGEGLGIPKEEEEANRFAAEILVPEQHRAEMVSLGANGISFVRFARKIGVSPGIVVGQLQHLGILRRNQLNNLKRRFEWTAPTKPASRGIL